ncbi:hypothetical protein NIES4074_08390 [Cylindrospermum sp. NIES-4074]|nr:hypothetical protein NIES4074_08390 [Cylindrospermum sp. NIES-4074]
MFNNSSKPASQTYPITCKRCKAKVFYYINDFGSKVVFNELGKPWGKHEYGCPADTATEKSRGHNQSGFSGMRRTKQKQSSVTTGLPPHVSESFKLPSCKNSLRLRVSFNMIILDEYVNQAFKPLERLGTVIRYERIIEENKIKFHWEFHQPLINHNHYIRLDKKIEKLLNSPNREKSFVNELVKELNRRERETVDINEEKVIPKRIYPFRGKKNNQQKIK